MLAFIRDPFMTSRVLLGPVPVDPLGMDNGLGAPCFGVPCIGAHRTVRHSAGTDLLSAFYQAPCQLGVQSHPSAPTPQAVRPVSMTPCRPLELAGQLEGVASTAGAARMGQAPFTNAQFLGTAARLPASGFHDCLRVTDGQHHTAPHATPAKSFLGIEQRLEAEPSRNLESTSGSSIPASGGSNFTPAATPYHSRLASGTPEVVLQGTRRDRPSTHACRPAAHRRRRLR
jgi:hypothetical protein